VLSAAPPLRSLDPLHVLCAVATAAAYAGCVLPRIMSFGASRGVEPPRSGGPHAEVSFSYAIALSLAYVSLSFLGVNRMAQRQAPVRTFIFECMAVHNITQCLFNLYCFVMLFQQGRALGLGIWGNEYDASERGHALGGLVWLQYHCRQLQMFETAFMILRKKFQGVSFLHLYLRLLNLCGWYIACSRFGGGEAYFPALISSACQASVYGLYFSFSLTSSIDGGSTSPKTGGDQSQNGTVAAVLVSRAARIFELQIAQYVVCAVHSIGAAIWGNFPAGLSVLHLFVIGNGLVLYTDFHSRKPDIMPASGSASKQNSGSTKAADAKGCRRVTFSFDSCGWLFVYHFGVAAWLSEHMGLEVDIKNPAGSPIPQGVAFSGSSGGSLVSCVLGAGTKVMDVFEYILEQLPLCRRNPLEMFPAVERALRKFQYDDAPRRLTGRVRILLTRVTRKPPFIMGEIAEHYPDNDTAVQILCASCHVPMVAGILPRKVGDRYYYDGLIWPSRLLVPWRGAEGDFVVRVSACAAPIADVRMRRVPYWWAVLPPSTSILRGLFWCGYRDAARWFAAEPANSSTFDSCKCRRLPEGVSGRGEVGGRSRATSDTDDDSSKDDMQEGGAAARWAAARALLHKQPGGQLLPEKDPTTGENVEELVRLAEAMADRQGAAVQWALLAMLGVVLAGAAAVAPVLLL